MEQLTLINKDIVAFNEELKTFFSKLSEEAKKRTQEKTPKNKQKKRPGKGGGEWIYAKSDYFEDCLNRDFPGWSFVATKWEITGNKGNEEVVANIELRVIDHGVLRTISDVGGSEIKYLTTRDPEGGKHKTDQFLSISNDVKAAITDGLKRCCYRLGYARDLKVDPADTELSEEQVGLILNALNGINQETYDKIKEIMENSVNLGNYPAFVTKRVMPLLKKQGLTEGYNMLSEVFGEIIN